MSALFMVPPLFEALASALILICVLLPAIVALGGAAFIPFRREFWDPAILKARFMKHGWVILGGFAVVGLAIVQTQLNRVIWPLVALDVTDAIKGFEMGLHAPIQSALGPSVVIPLAVAYLIGFPFLIFFSLTYYVWLGKGRTAKRALAAFALPYLFAIPLFFIMPVHEVWTVGSAQNLAVVSPWIAQFLYAFNDVGNNFPSLHTAISVTLAYVAWKWAPRPFAYVSIAIAALIVPATVILGIHWFVDVVAGLALAAFVVWVIRRTWPDNTSGKRGDAQA